VRDADVIAAANKLGMAMVFSGVRALPALGFSGAGICR